MRLAVCLMLAVSATWSQTRGPGLLGSGTHAQKDGIRFHWETRAEPSEPKVQLGAFGTHTTPDGWIGKAIADPISRRYFGYELTAGRHPDGIQLTFRPLTATPELFKALSIEDPGSWKAVNVQVPPPQVLRDLEYISLDVMTNPSTGQKIVDYVTVMRNLNLVGTPLASTPSSDGQTRPAFFYGTLGLSRPTVTVTGSQGTSQYQADVSVDGPIVSFYIPAKGRYSLSLAAMGTFELAGTVNGSMLSFKLGGEQFRIRTNEPIVVPGATAMHPVYVLHEPNYRSDSPDRFSIATRSWP